MHLEILKELFERDLKRLYDEIEKYTDESNLWETNKGIANSGGNLCLHVIGNLNTYIGKGLGRYAYERNRELEFSLKGIPKAKLLEMIRDTITVVANSLDKVEDMNDLFPLLINDENKSIGYGLTHLSTHLTYHLGQINYHRRLLDQ